MHDILFAASNAIGVCKNSKCQTRDTGQAGLPSHIGWFDCLEFIGHAELVDDDPVWKLIRDVPREQAERETYLA